MSGGKGCPKPTCLLRYCYPAILYFHTLGKYVTLSLLKQMQNGDMVNIIHVTTDVMEISIPCDVIQDGPRANLEKFSTRIYFKKPLQVKVTYFSNATGEQKYITLQNLKTVSTEHFLLNRSNGLKGLKQSISCVIL